MTGIWVFILILFLEHFCKCKIFEKRKGEEKKKITQKEWKYLPTCAEYSVTSVTSDSVTPWTAACQDRLVHGMLQAKIMDRAALPFSRKYIYV